MANAISVDPVHYPSKACRTKTAARLFVTAWFVIGGITHFAYPEPFLRIMPPYIPFHLVIVYISGALELIGALGLWINRVRNLAGYGLMALTTVVTLANVHMFQHPDLFPNIPYWLLIVRFPIQVALIWLIWWCSKPALND